MLVSSKFHAVQKSSKACPVCGMAIQKQEGCNKMTCGSCGAYFCYRCNKPISGYEHFRDGGCVLFELSDIMRWEHELQDQINRLEPSWCCKVFLMSPDRWLRRLLSLAYPSLQTAAQFAVRPCKSLALASRSKARG